MNLNVAGIYLITNLINGKVYVGQSLNIRQRWTNHKNLRSDCPLLHKAILKYGIENFKLEVLHILDKNTNLFIDDDLNKLEVYYIEKYHSFRGDPLCNGYNLTTGGQHHVKMSDEARQRAIAGMKKYWSDPEARKKASKANLGKSRGKWSEERKRLFSISKKGKPLPLTDEHKAKVANNRRLKGQRIFEAHWELIKDIDKSKYGWTAKASKQTGLSCETICRVCKRMGVPVKAPKEKTN